MQVVSNFSSLPVAARATALSRPQKEVPAKAIPAQMLKAEAVKPSGIWETGAFSFLDILDAINPLQHIPIISTLYRKLTGDEMGYASRIVGDTLYSGIFGSFISGLVSAVSNVFIDATTGKDIGEHVMAAAQPQAEPVKISRSTMMPQSGIEPQAAVLSAPLRQQTMPVDQAVVLPIVDAPRMQAAIDQYKWQMLHDEVNPPSNYWG